MRREVIQPRQNWQAIVEAMRLDYHTADGLSYWNESACYAFTAAEIGALEHATNELEAQCLELVHHVVDTNLFAPLGLSGDAIGLIQDSWRNRERNIYGRFDFSLDGQGGIKLLEYNADTPTSLLEAAVIQWQWLEEVKPHADQFNTIHERLIEAWKRAGYSGLVHFSATQASDEDIVTVSYLEDTAHQAGLATQFIPLEDIGFDADAGRFVDNQMAIMNTVFKLYPWEMMIADAFAPNIRTSGIRFIEPAWKMILSNKGMLPLLHQMFPDSDYILPAFYEPQNSGQFVRKPFFSREGANVALIQDGRITHETTGEYGTGRQIYQAYHESQSFDGIKPVIGSWVIASKSAGIGIREDKGITTNLASFVPHYFECGD